MNDKAIQTIRHATILRSFSKTRRTRLPKQVYPKLIELSYAQALTKHLGHARNALTPLVHAIPHLLPAAQAARKDADESKQIQAFLDQARRQLTTAANPTGIEALARGFGGRAQQFNRVQLGRQVRSALGADVLKETPALKTVLDHFVAENAALIKSIPDQVVDQVEGIVNRAFSSGAHVDTVQAEIEERFDVAESRARLIARDQIGKIYGQTNQVRQSALGITSYIWRTSGDERVRDEHEERDGESFDWDDPPEDGNPGEPIQCRCSAEPVFSDILDGIDDAETTDE